MHVVGRTAGPHPCCKCGGHIHSPPDADVQPRETDDAECLPWSGGTGRRRPELNTTAGGIRVGQHNYKSSSSCPRNCATRSKLQGNRRAASPVVRGHRPTAATAGRWGCRFRGLAHSRTRRRRWRPSNRPRESTPRVWWLNDYTIVGIEHRLVLCALSAQIHDTAVTDVLGA